MPGRITLTEQEARALSSLLDRARAGVATYEEQTHQNRRLAEEIREPAGDPINRIRPPGVDGLAQPNSFAERRSSPSGRRDKGKDTAVPPPPTAGPPGSPEDLVRVLRAEGIRDRRVLAAFRAVPWAGFVPPTAAP